MGWHLRKRLRSCTCDIQAIVLRCLAKDPVERFADIDSLDRALASSASAEGWSARDATVWWKEYGRE
jgi:serine/threonine-protein kinase